MMKKTLCGAGLSALIGLTIFALSAYRLPAGVQFAAPHQDAFHAFASRIWFNRNSSARIIARLTDVLVPKAYADCYDPSKPFCNNQVMVNKSDSGPTTCGYCYEYKCVPTTNNNSFCVSVTRTDCFNNGASCFTASDSSCNRPN